MLYSNGTSAHLCRRHYNAEMTTRQIFENVGTTISFKFPIPNIITSKIISLTPQGVLVSAAHEDHTYSCVSIHGRTARRTAPCCCCGGTVRTVL